MRPSIVTLFIALSALMPAHAEANRAAFDPARIGWTAAQFKASKFFFSMYATLSIDSAEISKATAALTDAAEGAVIQPGAAITELRLQSNGLGLNADISLLLNTDTGAALQRTSHDTGRRTRHRIYRFTDRGAYQKTWWPVGEAQESLPRESWPEWSERAEGLFPYPDEAVGQIVTEPAGLLYLIGASDLRTVGDAFEIIAYIRRRAHRVRVEVVGTEEIREKFDEFEDGAKLPSRDKIDTIQILIRGRTLGEENDYFEMIGLRGDIKINLDPITRAPLLLNGSVRIAGQVTMRIQRLERAATP